MLPSNILLVGIGMINDLPFVLVKSSNSPS